MSITDTPNVFIVDDEASVREGGVWLLRTRRLLSESFDSAEAFMAVLQSKSLSSDHIWQPDPARLQQSACILLDVRMTGMCGLTLFKQLLVKGMALAWSVIFLTGHADVPTAVGRVKRGAFDFCEKPISDNALVDRLEQALALSQDRLAARQTQQRLQWRLLELTERERDVMRLVVEGLPDKLIADQRDTSARTVEMHRARVFDKIKVKPAVDLTNLMSQLP